MNNFDFLKKEKKYDRFSKVCIEAEETLVVSYSACALITRKALELAVKFVYSYDNALSVPYNDNLSSLIHDNNFRDIIDYRLFPKLRFIKDLGNKAAHTASNIGKDKALLSLKNLYEFISWIDYSYSDELHSKPFDQSLLIFKGEQEKKTQKQLEFLYNRLEDQSKKDKKLEELIKENEKLRAENSKRRIENHSDVSRPYNVEDISEFQTRKLYIDLEIENLGWKFNKNCREEVEVTGMPYGSGVGYIDYVLYGDDGLPLAVIEAKKTCKDPKTGKKQATLYADCLEKQYGRRPLIFLTNGFDYYFWDDNSYPERVVSGLFNKDELEWKIKKNSLKKPLNSLDVNPEISGRPYQIAAIQAVCDTFMSGRTKALLVMATGSGKTRTAVSIVDVLSKNSWVKNVLFLADRVELVKQAKNSFHNNLPNLSLCNLLDSKKDLSSRMIFSTYPTIINAIDDKKRDDGTRLFSAGHFDLIIIDESHRSIYKKYKMIFEYFDAALIGLTATPKSEIKTDKNTYRMFELEDGVPTFAYEYNDAVKQKFLVPYNTREYKMKFLEKGIKYSELSDSEKEHFEETFDEEVTEIDSSELNKFLFNENTIDRVIQHLMEDGLKIEGGDKLGKTIIFAKSIKHADFILERFNKLYPNYAGKFADCIYNGIRYVEKTYDDFKTGNKFPQIAISVDMLDTGVDVPEILNLVFFKKVRSHSKFWQMIGRGTRLCPDLYGIGHNKENFTIFDYCGNFEYFNVEKKGKEGSDSKSLTEQLYLIRVEIIKELQHINYQDKDYKLFRERLISQLLGETQKIDETGFQARMKIKYVHKYINPESWRTITDDTIRELDENLAMLIPSSQDKELVKRFDLLMYTIIFCHLKGLSASKQKKRVLETADNLAANGHQPEIIKNRDLIEKINSDDFWNSADIFDYEEIRTVLRDLLDLLNRDTKKTYYTNFTDEVLSMNIGEGNFNVNDLKSYKLKVEHYLNEHKEDIAIYKLRNNEQITTFEVEHLEDLLWHVIGTKEDYQETYGNQSLLKLVSSLVGLERSAAIKHFSDFLNDNSLNSNQIHFIEIIIEHVIENGLLDTSLINEPPFSQYGSIIELFHDKSDTVQSIIKKVKELNSRVEIENISVS